jgi:hypothetical protein
MSSNLLHPGDSPTQPIMKLAIAWVATVTSSVTLQDVMIACTIIYTILQVYILLRDKVFKKRKPPLKEDQWL